MSLISNNSYFKENLIFALVGLVGVASIFLICDVFELNETPVLLDKHLVDIPYLFLPLFVIGLGSYLVFKYRLRGDHGKAWLFFVLAISFWYVGETTFSYDIEIDPLDISTLTSHIFYILGYPFFFAFTIFFLRPRKNIISKKLIVTALVASLLFLVTSLYLTVLVDDELDSFEVFLYGLYPVLGGILLAPSIIAVILFFRGQVNLLWIMILLASFVDVTADSIYFALEIDDTYDVGHPIDILYLWTYVLYALGIWSFIRTYKSFTKPKTKPA